MAKLSPLSVDETRALILAAQSGDQRALVALLEANAGLVRKAAQRWCGPGVPFEDLVQEGRLGLIEAIRRFDPARGCRLSTYATIWIERYIQRGWELCAATISLPPHVRTEARRLAAVQERLETALGQEATPEELAVKAGITCLAAKRYARLPLVVQSLEEVAEEGEDPFGATIAGDEDVAAAIEARLIAAAWRQAVDALPAEYAQVLILRFGLDGQGRRTLAEVSRKTGLSREGARRREQQALFRLRKLVTGTALCPEGEKWKL